MVNVYNVDGTIVSNADLPDVFKVQIRPDIVKFAFKNVNKNKRQAYAVNPKAGHRATAESWGTGRATSRIPRVGGSGSHKCGQAAYGNMCNGGHMFAPTQVYRKIHIKTNQDLKRYSIASALAASAVPGLVLARGHRIEQVPQIPLVISKKVSEITKTSKAVELLKNIGAYDDVEKAKESKTIRAGVGKMRNRRYTKRKGPLVIYKSDNGITHAFRNIVGVDLLSVNSLNILKLAPGGHIGRFVIWVDDAFNSLNELLGTFESYSLEKSGFHLPRPLIKTADFARLARSDEIQSVIKPAGDSVTRKKSTQRKNPLRNRQIMVRLNPYAKVQIRKEIMRQEKQANRMEKLVAKKKNIKSSVKKANPFVSVLLSDN